jgi:hypothetical protein
MHSCHGQSDDASSVSASDAASEDPTTMRGVLFAWNRQALRCSSFIPFNLTQGGVQTTNGYGNITNLYAVDEIIKPSCSHFNDD